MKSQWNTDYKNMVTVSFVHTHLYLYPVNLPPKIKHQAKYTCSNITWNITVKDKPDFTWEEFI